MLLQSGCSVGYDPPNIFTNCSEFKALKLIKNKMTAFIEMFVTSCQRVEQLHSCRTQPVGSSYPSPHPAFVLDQWLWYKSALLPQIWSGWAYKYFRIQFDSSTTIKLLMAGNKRSLLWSYKRLCTLSCRFILFLLAQLLLIPRKTLKDQINADVHWSSE